MDFNTITVGIIDDNEFVRKVIKVFLSNHKDKKFELTLEMDSLNNLNNTNSIKAPQVILLDINMPGIKGSDGIPLLLKHFPESAIIMFTGVEEEGDIIKCIHAGARGYVEKQVKPEELTKVIEDVIEGGSYISPILTRRLFSHLQCKSNLPEELSMREQDIVKAILEGLSYKLVASRHRISLDTVRGHIRKIYRKLKINSKGELYALFKV